MAWALALLTCAVAAGFAWFPLMDTDIWWHLAAGRLIVQQRRFLHVDPFAADTLGMPWVDVHWLFQVMVYLLHQAGGVALLVVAKAAVVGLGAGLAVRSACSRLARPAWLPAAAIVLGFLYPARHLLLARPTIFTLLALTVTLLVLDHIRRTDDLRWALLLFPIQILWANVQGLYLLGPGLVACVVVGDWLAAWLAARAADRVEAPVSRRIRRGLALCVPALVLASCLSPYGPRGLGLPFHLFGRISPVGHGIFSREVSENLAPWLLERASPGELAAFKWLAALTFLSFLPVLRRAYALGRLCVCVLFFVLALTANRNVLLFLWLAGPMVAENLLGGAAARHLPARPWLRRGLGMAAVAAIAALGLARVREARGEPPLAELAPFRVPVAAVDHLLALVPPLPPGPIFCSDRYGGYLAWRLGPRHLPTMDGRLVLRSARSYAEHLALGEQPERFPAHRTRLGFRAALIPAAYPDRFLPLVTWLLHQPEWRLLFTDGTQTLFAYDPDGRYTDRALQLTAKGTVAAIDDGLRTRLRPQPLVLHQARLHLARLAAEAGATEPADAILASLPGITAEALRARVAYRSGDVARAERMAQALLARVPDESESLCLLALLAHERGEDSRALDHLRHVLAEDPFHPLARMLLDQIVRR